MIRLSEDKKTVLSISSFEELKERPGFKESLDVRQVPLKEVIGVYALPENIPCGISTCHTGHKKGYLAVVEGGEEICVGNVCGKSHFGTDWTEAKSEFQVIANAARFRENIEAAQNIVPLWEQQVAELAKPVNANGTAYRNMRIQLGTALPEHVQEKLRKRAKTGDAVVKRVRQATKQEREVAAETTSGRNSVSIIEEPIYVIKGLSAVPGHAKLRQIDVGTLQQDIETFASIDAQSIDFEDLKYWNRWQGKMESEVSKLQRIHQECLRFIDQNNLASIRGCGSAL